MIPIERGRSRRGQGMPIEVVVGLILAVLVLVVVLLGFIKGWDWVFGKFDLLPGQSLETIAQGCNAAAQAGLYVDYCAFKKIKLEGKTQYVNCLDERLTPSFDDTAGHEEAKTKCSETFIEDYCTNVLKGTLQTQSNANTGEYSCEKRKTLGWINNRLCCANS